MIYCKSFSNHCNWTQLQCTKLREKNVRFPKAASYELFFSNDKISGELEDFFFSFRLPSEAID